MPLAEWPFDSPVAALVWMSAPVWTSSLQKVSAAAHQRPFGDPVQLGKNSQAASKVVRARLARLDAIDAKRLLHALGSLPDDEFPNFDSARQIVAALRVVQSEAGGSAELRKSLDAWAETLDLDTPEKKAVRRAQQKLAIGVLEKLGTGTSRRAFRTDAAFLDALDAHNRTGFGGRCETDDAATDSSTPHTENGGTRLTLEIAKDGAARRNWKTPARRGTRQA